MGNAVIFDIDGTLANCDHRRHHVESKPKNWTAFYEGMDADAPVDCIVLLAKALEAAGLRIICCSGRPDNYRERTLTWLKKHGIPVWELYMRHEGDYRTDVIVKRELLQTIKCVFDPVMVIDDRASVVKMWREEGLPCLQCAEGDF